MGAAGGEVFGLREAEFLDLFWSPLYSFSKHYIKNSAANYLLGTCRGWK
jgi:hypothetical protein